MDTSHSLLKTVGIPWDVPIDEKATELQVYTLAGCIRTDENLYIRSHEQRL